ncbi:MAG: PTS sugar transporter subunit IIA, partial [Finegoldia magna]|nr:PTS sugar transporter subunit IIA [Finegoldia magna]
QDGVSITGPDTANGTDGKVGIAGKDGEHLDLLSKIAITFSEEDNVDRIVNAKSAEEIKQVFEEADA